MPRSGHSIRTSVLIISDTHNADPFPDGIPKDFPHIDLLLHAGDLTISGTRKEFYHVIQMLKRIPADVKLVIPGNHDLTLDKVWMSRSQSRLSSWEKQNSPRGWKGTLGEDEWHRAERMWFGPESRAAQAGITMLREGKHRVLLRNGAKLKIYASPFQPVYCDWAFAYNSNQDRFNPRGSSLIYAENIAERPMYTSEADMRDVDIVMTHGPPFAMRDRLKGNHEHAGCIHGMKAIQRCRPKIHCFGHIHEGYGAERINWKAVERARPDFDAPIDTRGFRRTWKALASAGCVTRVVPRMKSTAKLCLAETIDKARADQETLMVNAAMMDTRYHPVNRPWLVYVDLPAAV